MRVSFPFSFNSFHSHKIQSFLIFFIRYCLQSFTSVAFPTSLSSRSASFVEETFLFSSAGRFYCLDCFLLCRCGLVFPVFNVLPRACGQNLGSLLVQLLTLETILLYEHITVSYYILKELSCLLVPSMSGVFVLCVQKIHILF